jgi:hypothetical protein
MNPKPFPIDEFPTLPELCKEVFKHFSKSSILLNSAGRATVEAQYQDEFYRVFKTLLGNSVGISSEWARGTGGRIDFRILGPKWGVEFLVDGTRTKLSEHYGRFQPDGQYYWWISQGFIRDWLIIDCRCSKPGRTSKFTSLLHLWVTLLIVSSAKVVETVACCIYRGLFDGPYCRCRRPRNHAQSLLDELITKGKRDIFLNCFTERQDVFTLSFPKSLNALRTQAGQCQSSEIPSARSVSLWSQAFLPTGLSGSTKFCCKNFSPVPSEYCAHDYHAA